MTAIPTQTFDQLNRAIEVNKQNVEAFKGMIVDQLNQTIAQLKECDPTNASDALDLTIPQLTSVVAKLNDKRGLSYTDVENIMAPLKAIQLRKAPDSATPATPLSIGPKRNTLSGPSASLQSPTLPPASATPAVPPVVSALPKQDLSGVNPGKTQSTGNVPPQPIRRMPGGRRTRRKTRR